MCHHEAVANQDSHGGELRQDALPQGSTCQPSPATRPRAQEARGGFFWPPPSARGRATAEQGAQEAPPPSDSGNPKTTGAGPSAAATRTPALVLLQVALANADGHRRYLHQLVVLDEFQGLLQAEAHGRGEEDVLVRPGSPDVG